VAPLDPDRLPERKGGGDRRKSREQILHRDKRKNFVMKTDRE
jgi:hypothetical protein